MSKSPADAASVYLDTVSRLEPNIGMIDEGAFYASAAISLKRIADTLEKNERRDEIYSQIFNALKHGSDDAHIVCMMREARELR